MVSGRGHSYKGGIPRASEQQGCVGLGLMLFVELSKFTLALTRVAVTFPAPRPDALPVLRGLRLPRRMGPVRPCRGSDATPRCCRIRLTHGPHFPIFGSGPFFPRGPKTPQQQAQCNKSKSARFSGSAFASPKNKACAPIFHLNWTAQTRPPPPNHKTGFRNGISAELLYLLPTVQNRNTP
jgi:hypothetical protein